MGVETQTGFAAMPFGFSSGLDATRTTMKFGYDLGRFKPYVLSSFAETRPALGANAFAGPAAPFAPTGARVSTVGAGFDYAVTDKLSLGVSVSASQVSSGWQR